MAGSEALRNLMVSFTMGLIVMATLLTSLWRLKVTICLISPLALTPALKISSRESSIFLPEA